MSLQSYSTPRPSVFAAAGLAHFGETDLLPTAALASRLGRTATGATHPFVVPPIRCLLFATHILIGRLRNAQA